ncbi:ATP-NAD kinase [Phanerochaete sordida]|uniref:ATP-NAD kinase n=1 Tax=Phanerochaete sordida TaxID=48140 RepID=A0A9P3LJI1_9APHY|nr:ATP-NAD kinase [Phanerochaete sordida]
MFSPAADNETFSTPPQSPMPPTVDRDVNILDRPSLSRRSSRPSSLRIQQALSDLKPDIVIDHQLSPDVHNTVMLTSVRGTTPTTAVPTTRGPAHSVPATSPLAHSLTPNPKSPRPPHVGPDRRASSPMRSPCFVHSQLQGPSFTEWLRGKHQKAQQEARIDGPPKAGDVKLLGEGYPDGTVTEPAYETGWLQHEEDEDETAGSLTKQLAETAVGVREMSKQLGRTRVHSNIQSVLIVTKARDNRLIKLTRELTLYLMLKPGKSGRGMIVYVDNQLKTSRRFDAAGMEKDHPELFIPVPRRRSSSSSSLASMASSTKSDTSMPEGQLRYWTSEMCSRQPHLFDFVVTLGGDGTVLFTSWLFQRIVPPVLPFALGSLGFLTNFDFADHQSVMDNAIDAGIRVNLRMRFTCTVYRAIAPEPGKGRRAIKKGDTGEILMRNLDKCGWEALESGHAGLPEGKCSKDKEIMCYTTRPVESFEVLNDLVVDRGPSPYVSLLELFGDEQHLTTVQADGLTISTPTGSTAYSLSAGGSLVHPEIPAILITPICPHTLSFRPLLLPDTMELRVCVPFNSRSTAWASFDGRGRIELKQGDHIKITASKYPFPTVCSISQSTDWFQSISRTLKWNERERQKSFVVVEESPVKKRHRRRSSSQSTASASAPDEQVVIDDDDDEEDTTEEENEEDEKFDIDDLSSAESSSPHAKASPEQPKDNISPVCQEIGHEKAVEQEADEARSRHRAEIAARAIAQGSPILKRGHRSRSRPGRSGIESGIETPDRFASTQPHPPRLSPRHVQFQSPDMSASSSSASIADQHHTHHMHTMERDATLRGERGARDDIHSPRGMNGSRNRIPRDRDIDSENARTPTASVDARRRRSRDRRGDIDGDAHPRRAFAVWGQDESDSAASDSEPY